MAEPQAIAFDGTFISSLIKQALGSLDLDAYREQAKSLALSLYDQYVVPHDFPRIPNFIEPTAKRAVREAIPGAVDSIFDALKKPGAVDKTAQSAADAFKFLTAPKAE